ncbi:7:8-dihydro-8-oxoguanine triphosphatase-like protein [Dinothrombium tinctorium]|uniref:Oxidized purine nucleoside triphosphate hydrolase n=1 Tax=Dinothrombium tinctorium TaxID=1965070 RepID=A0A443R2U4_9ACAR|nr:7:8-dihydro-8-oxoguanine triphosphatase-like protein [Dinothrombium tinctorium]RWS09576.1 7:8-dihydro-8-oxoguanine triphosphatase-like protein [Dinothrombium tinctorium]
MKPVKVYTLVFVFRENQVLLGMKQRGFGQDHYMGFGGKLELNETLYQCAVRELNEECGLIANSLTKLGVINFDYQGEEHIMEVHIYVTSDFDGVPVRSEEMDPKWFSVDNIPYDQMLRDSPYWFPKVLKNEKLNGFFEFDENKKIINHSFNDISGV